MGGGDTIPCRKLPSWVQCPACLQILLSSAWPLGIKAQLGFACCVLGVFLYWLWSNSINQVVLLDVGRGKDLSSPGINDVTLGLGPGAGKTSTHQPGFGAPFPLGWCWHLSEQCYKHWELVFGPAIGLFFFL